MAARPRIAVDAMGGDGGPAVTCRAAADLAGIADLTLVGDAEALRSSLAPGASLRIEHAANAITSDMSLTRALRGRGSTSLGIAVGLLASGQVDAVVSGADTALLMALARAELGMIEGFSRPAILKALGGKHGRFYMLDLGANIDCDVDLLVQFATMGQVAAQRIGGVARPRIGLLNIGSEPDKGPAVVRECAARLAAAAEFEFAGFVEASQLFDNRVDVVVCDGFAGNIALKAVEGAASMAGHLLTTRIEALDAEQRRMLEASTLLQGLGAELDPESYNGAVLVGLDGIVVKSHGSATAVGFAQAIEEAVQAARGDLAGCLSAAAAPH